MRRSSVCVRPVTRLIRVHDSLRNKRSILCIPVIQVASPWPDHCMISIMTSLRRKAGKVHGGS